MKLLVTGGGGFLGEALTSVLTEQHDLVVLDPRPGPEHPRVTYRVGSVAEYGTALAALAGCEGLVIAHMAPRSPDAYVNPEVSFQINVTGTANLFHAARVAGLSHVVLISSESAVSGYGPGVAPGPDSPPKANDDLYAFTKSLQETVAEHFARVSGMGVTVLRIGYVVDGKSGRDKYGKAVKGGGGQTDRFDIARAAAGAVNHPTRSYRTYFVTTGSDHEKKIARSPIVRDLGWKPVYLNGVAP